MHICLADCYRELVSALFLLAYVKEIMLYRTINTAWSALLIHLDRAMSAEENVLLNSHLI